jgi:hypothetical protein
MEKKLKIIIGKDSRDTKIYVGKHRVSLIQQITFEAIADGAIKTKLIFPNLFGNKLEDLFNKSHQGFVGDLLKSLILLKDIPNLEIVISPFEPISHISLNYKDIVQYINLKAFW